MSCCEYLKGCFENNQKITFTILDKIIEEKPYNATGYSAKLKQMYKVSKNGKQYHMHKSLKNADRYFIGWVLKHISIISLSVAILSLVLALIALCR